MSTFDASELDRFAAELSRATVSARDVVPVLTKAGMNVKNDWQEALGASTHFKGVKGTPSFDVEPTHDGLEVEVGPRTSGQVPGDLVSIAHFGGAHGGGGVTDPQEFLDAEAPRLEKALGDVIDKALP